MGVPHCWVVREGNPQAGLEASPLEWHQQRALRAWLSSSHWSQLPWPGPEDWWKEEGSGQFGPLSTQTITMGGKKQWDGSSPLPQASEMMGTRISGLACWKSHGSR